MVIIHPEPQCKRVTRADYPYFASRNLWGEIVRVAIPLGIGGKVNIMPVHIFYVHVWKINPPQLLIVRGMLPFGNFLCKECISNTCIAQQTFDKDDQNQYNNDIDNNDINFTAQAHCIQIPQFLSRSLSGAAMEIRRPG